MQKFIRLSIIFFLFNFHLSAQVTENFNDGDFINNPAWNGDVSQFIVNAQQQLQLSSSGTGISYLSSALNQNSLDSVEWRCYVEQPFSPSSSNYGRIYLVSDQSNLEGPLNGYFVQLGESLGNDAVELFQQSGTVTTSVARCTNGAIANSFAIGIRITRSSNAEWKIYIDYSGGANYVFEASGTDATFNASSFFGVVCSYTSSNSANFFFDDFFTGPMTIDTIPPAITYLATVSSSTLDVKFSEIVEETSAENNLNYEVDNGLGNPISAIRDVNDFSLVHLSFSTNFIVNKIYTLTATNIKDVEENIELNTMGIFALPDTAKEGDIIINEILFNPFTGGSDFVELYNHSAKVIDLSQLKIANTDLATGDLDIVSGVSATRKLFYPASYIVLTENPDDIKSRYTVLNPVVLTGIADLPTYNDDEDEVVLLDASLTPLDRFHYKDDFHFPLLNDKEGISLERISFIRITQDSTNWHSAAKSAGYATPGYKNSQYSESVSDGSEITIDPEIFSPDNDGHNDVLNIHYKYDKPGYTANVHIYTSKGQPVVHLIKNELLGTSEGTWTWNGINDDNEKALTGIYILYIEVFQKGGDVRKTKKVFVLGTKL